MSRPERVSKSRDRARETIAVWAVRIVVLAGILGLWFYLSRPGGVSRLIIPQPTAVLKAFGVLLSTPDFWSNISVTLIEILVAFLLAAVCGVAFGFWVARKINRVYVLEPMVAWGYMIPLVLFYPMFVLWSGVDMQSKIAYSAVSAFFPIAYNAIRGFASVSPTWLKVARGFGATRRQTDLVIKIPAGLPLLSAGLRIGAASSMITVIFCEMVASARGLGNMLSAFTESLATPKTYGMIIIILVIVGVLQQIVAFVLDLPIRKYSRTRSARN